MTPKPCIRFWEYDQKFKFTTDVKKAVNYDRKAMDMKGI
jgi:hypothetical protein